MNLLATLFDAGLLQAQAERMGWVLVHSLWQITLLAGAGAMVMRLLRNRSAATRYIAGCVTLLTMLGLSMGTYILLPPGAAPTTIARVERAQAVAMPPLESPAAESNLVEADLPAVEPDVVPLASAAREPDAAPATGGSLLADLLSALRPYLPWATAVWLAGVLLLSLRPIWGWLHVRRLQRHGLSPLSDALARAGERLTQRLGVNRAVRFAQSALVEVPAVVGYLRPLVLLPASAISGLSISEIEMILAHELAHVRRHD